MARPLAAPTSAWTGADHCPSNSWHYPMSGHPRRRPCLQWRCQVRQHATGRGVAGLSRWVVAKDEAAARAKAEQRFPGQQLTLKQVCGYSVHTLTA